MSAVITDADRELARDEHFDVGDSDTDLFYEHVAQVAADARERENEACEAIMGKVIADNGCDCDFDAGPHERIPCEQLGHDPCLACLMQRAIDVIAARRAG